jgi:hypothetical protein
LWQETSFAQLPRFQESGSGSVGSILNGGSKTTRSHWGENAQVNIAMEILCISKQQDLLVPLFFWLWSPYDDRISKDLKLFGVYTPQFLHINIKSHL